MLRFLLPVVVATLALADVVVPARAAAQAPALPSSNALHAALGGRWTGTLRYRDYQDSTRFVSLPTAMDGTVAADSTSVRLDFIYDDGPGKTVRSSDTFSLNAQGNELRWGPTDGKRAPSVFAVQQLVGSNPRTLVAETVGSTGGQNCCFPRSDSSRMGRWS